MPCFIEYLLCRLILRKIAENVKVKSKTTSVSSKAATTTTTKTSTTKVRQKKVYTLPGQKYDPPEEVLIPGPNSHLS